MKKKLLTMALTATITLATGLTAFAGQWIQDTTGWWYQYEDNTYATGWQWISGGDGVSRSYYFDGNGYMAANTTIDGYTVNSDGQWTVNGAIQTRQQEAVTDQANLQTFECGIWLIGANTEGFDPVPEDYYAAQLYNTSQFLDFYDPTGTVLYTRGNKPEWVDYAETTNDTLVITGEIFKDQYGMDAIKIFDLHIKQ